MTGYRRRTGSVRSWRSGIGLGRRRQKHGSSQKNKASQDNSASFSTRWQERHGVCNRRSEGRARCSITGQNALHRSICQLSEGCRKCTSTRKDPTRVQNQSQRVLHQFNQVGLVEYPVYDFYAMRRKSISTCEEMRPSLIRLTVT